MRKYLLAAMIAAASLCTPVAAQRVQTLPAATTLTGSESMAAVQGSGCAANTTPCAPVRITPTMIAAYLAPNYQPSDADLSAIAALTTADYGRQLLTKVDAASVRSYLGLGSVDNTADVSKSVLSATRLTTARTLSVTGDTSWSLTFDGSGNVSGTSALGTSGVTAGSYTNANITVDAKGRITSAANGAAGGGGSGTVTSFAFTNANGFTGSVANGSTQPNLTISQDANSITDAKLTQVATATFKGRATAATGNVETLTAAQATGLLSAVVGADGTNAGTKGLVPAPAATDNVKFLSGAGSFGLVPLTSGVTGTLGVANGGTGNTTGNAPTAAKLATARAIAGAGDTTWTVSFDGSADVSGTTTIGANKVTFGKLVAATQPAIVGATAAGNFAEQTPASGRSILGVTATGADTTYAFRANNLSDVASVATARGNLVAAKSGANNDITSLTGLTTALSVAQGGTGDTGAAWTSYTPNVSCGSGTLGSATTKGRYKTLGKTVFVWIEVNISSNGTCATDIRPLLPIATRDAGSNAYDYQALSGAEVAVAGKSLRPVAMNASTNVLITNFDGSYAGANGYVIVVSGFYEAA